MLFRYEVIAVTRKNVAKGIISASEGSIIRDKLLQQNVEYIITQRLLRLAYELATQLNRPTAYDSQYLALAESLQCDFWTADERLFNAVSSQLKWVGNLSP